MFKYIKSATIVFIVIGMFIFACPNISRMREDKGEIIARINFVPKPNGFGFRNYGSKHEGANDLTAADMAMIFGVDNVCIEGDRPQNCILTEPAEMWMEKQIEGMKGGHCEGMSVASLRLFLNRQFKNKTSPAQWQSSAKTAFDLQLNPAIANYIAYYHVVQTLPEVSDFRAETWKKPPSEILQMIIDSFKTRADLYTMSIGMRGDDGKYTRGHAIVPIAVEDMGDDEYRVHVYDNNFPNMVKYVEINTEEETWRYHTANNPDDVERDYVGDAESETLGLKRMSDREVKQFTCPFCEDSDEEGDSSHASNAKYADDEMGFFMDGEGDLLIADPAGKRVGYDANKKKFVNEIPEADILPYEGGLDLNIPPTIYLPYNPSAKRPYTVTISGKSLKQEVDADLMITGPGFVVGFEYILLDQNESLTMTISPDGRELSFISSADGETPNIFLTTEDGPNKPSYEIEIGGILLEAGKAITVKLDLAKSRIYFSDNDAGNDKYDVYIERTNPNGTKNVFDTKDMDLGKADRFMIDFSKWDGKNKMQIKVDEDGDGFDDEPTGN